MAREFNGTSQYLKYDNLVVSQEPLTLAARFVPTDLTRTQTIVAVSTASDTIANTMRFMRLRGDLSGDPIAAQAGGNIGALSPNSPIAGAWNHAVAVFISKTERWVMLNGGPIGYIYDDMYWLGSASHASIGILNWDNVIKDYWAGLIADVAIWNAALSQDEALAFCQGMPPHAIRPGNLQWFVPLWGCSNPEADLSGSRKHPTVYNGAPLADHAPVGSYVFNPTPFITFMPTASVGTVPRFSLFYERLRRSQ